MITLAEIQAVATPEQIAEGNFHDLAALVNATRTRRVATEIGNGTILETLGIEAGNQLLDAIYGNPAFKYVVPLLEQGRLNIASDVSRGALDMLAAASAVTVENAEILKNLAPVVTDAVTWEQVREAVEKGV